MFYCFPQRPVLCGSCFSASIVFSPLSKKIVPPRSRQERLIFSDPGDRTFCCPDLLRLLRLFGHCDRLREDAWLRFNDQLPAALFLPQLDRILAAMAYFALFMVFRLPLLSNGWNPPISWSVHPQHHNRFFIVRPVARRGVDIYYLGCMAWCNSMRRAGGYTACRFKLLGSRYKIAAGAFLLASAGLLWTNAVVLVGCALFRARSFDDALTVVTGVAHLGRLDYGMLVTLGFPSYFEILLLGVHITLLFAIDFLIFARPHI